MSEPEQILRRRFLRIAGVLRHQALELLDGEPELPVFKQVHRPSTDGVPSSTVRAEVATEDPGESHLVALQRRQELLEFLEPRKEVFLQAEHHSQRRTLDGVAGLDDIHIALFQASQHSQWNAVFDDFRELDHELPDPSRRFRAHSVGEQLLELIQHYDGSQHMVIGTPVQPICTVKMLPQALIRHVRRIVASRRAGRSMQGDQHLLTGPWRGRLDIDVNRYGEVPLLPQSWEHAVVEYPRLSSSSGSEQDAQRRKGDQLANTGDLLRLRPG